MAATRGVSPLTGVPVKRVREGVYQIVSPFPEYHRREAYAQRLELEAHPRVTRGLPYVLPYFVCSRGDTLLVDCGWNTQDAYAALEEQLAEVGCGIGDIQTLVLTHAHPDHCGLAGRLKAEAGCSVWLHELEIPFLRTRYQEPEVVLDALESWFARHGVPPGDRTDLERGSMALRFLVAELHPDRPVRGGETLQVGDFLFEVIWTPGHSPGHICLYEPNHRLLLSGDHVLPTITPNVSLHPQQRQNPLSDFLESLDRVAGLEIRRMLPAHEWDIEDFQGRIRALRDHHRARLEDMLAAVGHHESVTALEVAQRVQWTTGSYESFPPWMKRAAIGEALSHLVYLAGQGRLVQREEDGLVRFQRA